MPRPDLSSSRAVRRLFASAAVAATATASVLVAIPSAGAVSPDVVISEVYGGGGNTGAPFTNDFIELYNRGSVAVNVSTWSVQYGSSAGSTYLNKTNLVGTIAPGDVYLVQEFGGANGVPLPPADVTGTINLSSSSGKVALVTNQTSLPCGTDCDMAAGVRDFVGYGSANDSETTPAGGLNNTSSVSRNADGDDTDNNAVDFSVGDPSPGELPDQPPGATPLAIYEIQGVGHLSDDEGDLVLTSGVVTAVSTNGYWVQDPTGDANVTTSDGLFVFSGSGGTKPAVGNAVSVTGTVDEFRPGSATGPGLNITELTGSTFTVTAPVVPLPAPVVIGPDGVLPPADVIDNDSPTRIDIEVQGTYDPTEDAIDFYEQYEGMLLQLDSATAVGPTNSFGEIVVLPPGDHPYTRTANGGVVYSGYDKPNPRRLTLDDVLLGTGNMPIVNTGDVLTGPIVGPLDYGFNNYRLYPKTIPAVESGGTTPEQTTAAKTPSLAVATFNVENLDPTDPQDKFDRLAAIIVTNLKSPDVVTLEEVQDNNGATNDGTVAADQTLSQLIAAVTAVGGPAYDYRQIDPVNNADGGEPGGNIRNAFLFRTDRGLRFVDRGEGDATTPTTVATTPAGKPALTLSPGRVDPTNPAWDATRKPLAGEFIWKKERVFIIANHFSSKGGDEPLFGRYQPPTRSSEVKRQQQATVVNTFVDQILTLDPNANVIVAGDLNDFEFSQTLTNLRGNNDLYDLVSYLPPSERYTYVFEGNSQALDHLLVSPGLLPGGTPTESVVSRAYDIVHVNADFADQASDHDPQVVRLVPQRTP